MGARVLAATVFCMAALTSVVYSGNGLSYSGSSTIGMGILEAGALKAYEAESGKKFMLVEMPGSGKGIDALLVDKVSIAGVSRPLKKKEKQQNLVGTIMGYDAIAIFVHIDNPVKNLTKAQLKGIFTGRIKNWKEVGGNDAPIEPNTEQAAIVWTTEKEIAEVSANKGAIGAVSVTFHAKGPRNTIRINTTRIVRPLGLITYGQPTPVVQKVIDFFTVGEGRKFAQGLGE